jgi:hypothetical protein
LPNADERRAVLVKLANAVAGEPVLYRCVVATRPTADNELHVLDGVLGYQAPRYDLQSFTTEDVQAYAKRYFGSQWPSEEAARRAHQFTRALRDTSLAELAQTPLMAFMLCQLYLAQPDRPLPNGRSGVYELFVDLIYENNRSKRIADSHEEAIQHLVEGVQSPQARRDTDEAARQVYERLPELVDYLAHQWLTATPGAKAYRVAARVPGLLYRRPDVALALGHPGPAVEELVGHEAVRRPSKVHPELWNAFLGDLLRHTGLLVHHADGLDFPHQTFLEYHAARHVTRNEHVCRRILDQLFEFDRRASRWLELGRSYLGFVAVWSQDFVDGLFSGDA